MKQFFKLVFASMVGFVLSIITLIFISSILIIGLIRYSEDSSENKNKSSANGILYLELNSAIPDRSSFDPWENFDFKSFSPEISIGLNEILKDLNEAKTDKNIKGVFIELSVLPNQFASIEEVRNAIIDFKKSGKFVYAYGDYYSQAAYYIATSADSIFLNPKGVLEFKGLHSSRIYFKDALDRLGIDIQVIRHGKYKGAVEPFIRNDMSDESRLQIKTYITSTWNHLLNNISASRKITLEELNKYADNLSVSNAQQALKYKMIDRLTYKDEVLELLRIKTAQKTIEDLNLISISEYGKANYKTEKNKIAVIYAEGDIEDSEGEQNSINANRYVETIRTARFDEDIKAIVLRINSPGGSAFASDVIWREIELAKKAKPIIVSMGNMAASGGYYIACNADMIIANPTTLTGSIGVFGILPNAKILLNKKLGIHIDVVSSNKHSDVAMPYRPLSEFERNIIQSEVDSIYNDFIGRVSDGRKMTKQAVDEIGQGRIWSAVDAQKNGLVDSLGGLTFAIDMAAKKANIKSYTIEELPKKSGLFAILSEGFSTKLKNSFLKEELKDSYKYYKQLNDLINLKGIQAKLPYSLNFE